MSPHSTLSTSGINEPGLLFREKDLNALRHAIRVGKLDEVRRSKKQSESGVVKETME